MINLLSRPVPILQVSATSEPSYAENLHAVTPQYQSHPKVWFVGVYLHTHTLTHSYPIHKYIHSHADTYTYSFAHTHTHTHTQSHTRAHTHTHHKHTYTCRRGLGGRRSSYGGGVGSDSQLEERYVCACIFACVCVWCAVFCVHGIHWRRLKHFPIRCMTYQAMSYGLGKSSQGYPCEASTAYQHGVGVHLVRGTSGCLLLVS